MEENASTTQTLSNLPELANRFGDDRGVYL
jgi:hypothetical protein